MEDGLCHRVTHKRTSKIHNAVSIVNTDKHFFLIKKKEKEKSIQLIHRYIHKNSRQHTVSYLSLTL